MTAYQHATADYNRASAMWDWKLRTLPTDKYKQLRDFIEKARLRQQETEAALRRHIAEHGCGDSEAT